MEKQNQAGDKGKITFYDRAGKQIEINCETGEDGLDFYAYNFVGNRYSIKTRAEHLVNELHRATWPLESIKNMLWDMTGDKDEEAPAIYYMLEAALDGTTDRIAEICDAVEKHTGKITIHCLEGFVKGLQKNEILAVTLEPIEPIKQPKAVPVQTDQDKRAYAENLLASAKQLQDSANSILAGLKDKPVKKRKAA